MWLKGGEPNSSEFLGFNAHVCVGLGSGLGLGVEGAGGLALGTWDDEGLLHDANEGYHRLLLELSCLTQTRLGIGPGW